MKKFTLLLFCFLILGNLSSQIRAITETGDEVVLNDDGTWVYVNGDETDNDEIPENPKTFEKDPKSSFLIKSNKTDVGFWINPKRWKFKKAESNPDAEYELEYKDGDLYGMIITEKIEVPILGLRKIALDNARAIAPDLKLVKEEFRNVNGSRVLLLQMNGTMQGIKFSYYGYYFSNTSGTVQFITYTSQNLIEDLKDDAELLLNGFVVINKEVE